MMRVLHRCLPAKKTTRGRAAHGCTRRSSTGAGGGSGNGSTAGGAIAPASKQIFDRYADQIRHKASKTGVSVNQLIDRTIPHDEVQQVRQTERNVASWRANYHRHKPTSFFVQVPWLADNTTHNRKDGDGSTHGSSTAAEKKEK